MNTKLITAALVAAIALASCATGTGTRTTAPQGQATASGDPVCMLRSALPANIQLTVLGQVEGSKEFYGSVNEILPLMADEARKNGSRCSDQFGHPSKDWPLCLGGTGTAVKLANKSDLNCLASGGTFQ